MPQTFYRPQRIESSGVRPVDEANHNGRQAEVLVMWALFTLLAIALASGIGWAVHQSIMHSATLIATH